MLFARPLRIALPALAIAQLFGAGAHAQVRTDGSLGPAQSLGGPNFAVTANLGRQLGANLFHSFAAFNLASGQSAVFSGPGDIANVIARVTGGAASSIDGVIRSTIAGANLFLINPRGILFGPNARLDLSGSFHASSADYLKLGGGGRFDATNPGASVLTAAAPEAFGFLGPNAGAITVQGSQLSVPAGGSLSLVGGPVTVSDAQLSTAAGSLRLIAMGSAGEVATQATGAALGGNVLAPLSIERSALQTRSDGTSPPGRIVLRGGKITVLDSTVASSNAGAVDAPPVELAAAGDLHVTGSNVTTLAEGSGRGADLRLTGANITVDRTALLLTESRSDGAGGAVAMSATGSIEVNTTAQDPWYTEVITSASGNGPAGSISFAGETVTVRSSNVYSNTSAVGSGGSIHIKAQDVNLLDGAFVLTWTEGGSAGHAGNIDVLADRKIVASGVDWDGFESSIYSETFGSGRSANIRFAAPAITLAGARVTSITDGSGDSGTVRFDGDVIRFLAGPRHLNVGAGSDASGNGGNVEIRATQLFEFNGSQSPMNFNRIANGAQGTGRGGDIIIESPVVVIDQGAVFSRTRWGPGDQGGIIVRAREVHLRNHAEINSVTEGERNGSIVLIEADSLQAGDASVIAAATIGSGDAGRITINARLVKLTGASSIVANSGIGTGNAGDIVLNIGESFEMSERRVVPFHQLFVGDQIGWPGRVGTDASGSGNAGTLFLRAPNVLLDDGRFVSTAQQSGRGGRVEIHAGNLVMRNGAQINARTAVGSSGAAGTIDINVDGRFEISGMSPIDGAFSGLYAETQGSGPGGSIAIIADSLTIDRGIIRSSTGGAGSGGTIRIRAGNVALRDGGWIDAGTSAGSAGAGGSIDIAAARSLSIAGSDRNPLIRPRMLVEGFDIPPDTTFGRAQGAFASTISSNTDGTGKGGNVNLSALQVTVADGGRVSANSSGVGAAGNVFLGASSVLLDDGRVQTGTSGSGGGGQIQIRATDVALHTGGQVDSRSATGSTGDAGSIRIDAANRLEISGVSAIDGALSGISAETLGSGRGGDIRIGAGTLTIERGFVRSSAGASGDAGTIDVRGADVWVTNGGSIDAGTAIGSGGAGGAVNVAASGSITVSGVDSGQAQGAAPSSISSNTAGAGAGGNVTLVAPQITLAAGGSVSANSSGGGTAGNIFIQAPDWLRLYGGSITTQATSSDGGNIDIRAGNMVRMIDAEISTSVGGGEGSGGNIFIDPTFVILERSRIAANAFGGAGGNINIIADVFLASPGSVLEASSQLGLPGQVQITAPRTDVISGLPALPAEFLDASGLIRQACGGPAGASRLVGVGRGGVTTPLSDYSSSRYFDAEAPVLHAAVRPSAARAPSSTPMRSVLMAGICANSG